MVSQIVTCSICSHVISHPICERCYLKHVNYWLNEIDVREGEKKEINKEIKRVLFHESMNEDTCIICRQESLSVCSYCFFLQTSWILTDYGFNEDRITDLVGDLDYNKEPLTPLGERKFEDDGEEGEFYSPLGNYFLE